MNIIEMKRDFKQKAGYTRIVMRKLPYEYYKKCIEYKRSFCYPADQDGKFVEYVQATREMTKEEANAEYVKLKKQGFKLSMAK